MLIFSTKINVCFNVVHILFLIFSNMKTNIIIISDDLLFGKIIIPLLNLNIDHLEIDVCTSVQEITTKLDKESCDLVLVDGGMTNMSSLEVIQFLRLKKNVVKPIWFFPEIQTQPYLYKAYEMGANRIINKPFDPYWVVNEIALLIDKQFYKPAV